MRHRVSRLAVCTRTFVLFLLIATLVKAPESISSTPWRHLEDGLELGTFTPPGGEPTPVITVLRIDPDRFTLELFNASASGNQQLTPKQWSQSQDLVAVINASMFQADLLTSVSLMQSADHNNNNYLSKDKTILAFDPANDQVPRVRIIDRQCDDLNQLKTQYKTLVQSIRMVSCKGHNVWQVQPKKSSVAAIAIDNAGKVLFIHTENRVVTHDLIDLLLALPLGLTQAMYTEGGPQAQLYINSNGNELELTGRLNPLLDTGTGIAWPLPNVIGVRRR